MVLRSGWRESGTSAAQTHDVQEPAPACLASSDWKAVHHHVHVQRLQCFTSKILACVPAHQHLLKGPSRVQGGTPCFAPSFLECSCNLPGASTTGLLACLLVCMRHAGPAVRTTIPCPESKGPTVQRSRPPGVLACAEVSLGPACARNMSGPHILLTMPRSQVNADAVSLPVCAL